MLADSLPHPTFLVSWAIHWWMHMQRFTSQCCQDEQFVKQLRLLVLLFLIPPEAAALPRAVSYSTPSLLSCPLHCHSYNSGCWLSLCSKLSCVFCSSRSLASFLFLCWFWALTTLSPAQTDCLRKAAGKKRSVLFLVHRERGFLPLMLHVTVRPQVWYFYLFGMPLFHLSTFSFSKRKKRLKWISANCSCSCHNAVHLQVPDRLLLSSFCSLRV